MKKRYEKRMKEVLENRLEKETFNNRLEGYNNSNYYIYRLNLEKRWIIIGTYNFKYDTLSLSVRLLNKLGLKEELLEEIINKTEIRQKI